MKPKNVIVLLVIALLCVGAWFAVDRLGGGAGGDGVLPPVWPEFDRNDVTEIAINTKARHLGLKKREGPTDRWDVVEGTELVRADANGVDDLLAALSKQTVFDRIEFGSSDAGPAKEYGLDAPIVEVDISAGKDRHHISYGKLSREGNKVYADSGEGTDIWLVPKDASDLAISALSSGLRSKRLFDQTAFDVATLEIVERGVTVAEFHRDTSQLWRMSQPWKGYPNPKQFDTLLSDIVNAEIDAWTEFGAPDLAKYGLAPPQREVRITPRGEGKRTESILVGAGDATGVFCLEGGTKTVVHVGGRFGKAVFADPLTYRDRSFTRLGHDGVAIEIRCGGVNYRLEKTGTWEVVIGTERRPAEGGKIALLLDRFATWQTLEFLDAQKPEDLGITDKDFIEITRQSVGKEPGAKIVLFFNPDLSKRPDPKSVYGRRKDDGAAERVESEPLDEMLRGPEQYFRRWVADIPPDAIDEMTRDAGYGDVGKDVQPFKLSRNVGDVNAKWKWDSDFGGSLGKPAGGGISEILAALSPTRLVPLEWLPFDPVNDGERMGLKLGRAETLSIKIHRANYVGIDPDPKIDVGRRREGGGYYARIVGANAGGWVFVLADDVVAGLSAKVEVVAQPKKDE